MSRGRPDTSASAYLREWFSAAEQADRSAVMPFEPWALQFPEPKAGKLDFERFPFQRELYASGAEHRELVIKKATQLGVSTYCIRWTMYWVAVRGMTGLYVFPKQRQLRDFSDARIRPLIAASPLLKALVPAGAAQNNGLKQLGRGFMYLRGSESVDDLQAVDADVMALDEYDTLVQANIPDAERRLGASSLGLVRRVGVPSYPDHGIAAQYDRSDRRQWFVRCGACRLRQPITFDNVDTDRLERVCSNCRRGLDVREGEWVAEFPDRDVRGYHVPRLIVPHADIGQLVRASRDSNPARRAAFVNKDLGLEYAPDDARLSLDFIHAAQRDYFCQVSYAGDNLVTMGVDVAGVRNLHVRISERLDATHKRALFLGEVEDFSALDELMQRYEVHICAIDAQPEHRLAEIFANRFGGRVYLVSYATNSNSVLAPVPAERRVSVARTEAIDATLTEIRLQHNLLPRELPPDYAAHLRAIIRVVESDGQGRKRPRYQRLADDDFLHAEVFDWVAGRMFLWQYTVAELTAQSQPVLVPIEKALPGFEPSRLAEYGNDEYHPGSAEPDFYEFRDW